MNHFGKTCSFLSFVFLELFGSMLIKLVQVLPTLRKFGFEDQPPLLKHVVFYIQFLESGQREALLSLGRIWRE